MSSPLLLWAAFDALVHVAVDMVEPPRIAGNINEIEKLDGLRAKGLLTQDEFDRQRVALLAPR